MEKRELAAIIETEVSKSIGNFNGDLSASRASELNFYNGMPFGNEVEGESQVVSTDVFDTVEGILPEILDVFVSSDDVVKFEPNGPEDEEQAKQQTEVTNYVFYRQNNGFLILYEWVKDALIQKNGVTKYWWDDSKKVTSESYRGISEEEFVKLANNPNVEITAHTEIEDETAKSQLQERISQTEKQIDALPIPDGAKKAQKQMLQQKVESIYLPRLHDVEIKVTEDNSKVCIEVVPPEEFGISARHKCVSMQEAEFVYHQTQKTVSWLRENGCPEEIIKEMGGGDKPISVDELARNRFTDEVITHDQRIDDSGKEVWVTDCFIRIDYNGDGIAELRHVIKAGSEIWVNEETDHINFAAITPIIMPHRFIGISVADLAMQDQFTKSVLLRQMLNNLYLTNNPTKVVLSSASGIPQANLEDLMVSRAGAIRREYVPNAIRNDEIPFVAGAAFPMLEYIDSQREVRTGNTRYSQGTDADTLNKTARGIGLIQQAGAKRGKLIARIIAETGVKDLMKGISYMLTKYSTKAMTVRLRNEWVDIDPRSWKTMYDMTINVGLGTGNKDTELAHLNAITMDQIELMKAGRGYMVTDENLYNTSKKRAEAMGFKNPELFVSDPQSVQKPPPAPNPDLLKIQQADKEATLKLQSNEKIRQFDAQTQKELEAIKSQTQVTIEQIRIQAQKEIEAMKIQAEKEIEVFRVNAQLRDEASNLQHQKLELNVDKELHNLSKQAAQNVPEPPVDQTTIMKERIHQETELKKTQMVIEKDLKVAEISAKAQKESAKPEPEEGGEEKLDQITAAIAKLSESMDSKNKPRKHVVKKVGDDYEITTVH